jgi:hypothetical protein
MEGWRREGEEVDASKPSSLSRLFVSLSHGLCACFFLSQKKKTMSGLKKLIPLMDRCVTGGAAARAGGVVCTRVCGTPHASPQESRRRRAVFFFFSFNHSHKTRTPHTNSVLVEKLAAPTKTVGGVLLPESATAGKVWFVRGEWERPALKNASNQRKRAETRGAAQMDRSQKGEENNNTRAHAAPGSLAPPWRGCRLDLSLSTLTYTQRKKPHTHPLSSRRAASSRRGPAGGRPSQETSSPSPSRRATPSSSPNTAARPSS